jgi:hypothetical protein
MKYILMMHAPRVGWEKAGSAPGRWTTSRPHIGFTKRFSQELGQAVPRLHDPEREADGSAPIAAGGRGGIRP